MGLAAALGELERSVSRQDPDRWISSSDCQSGRGAGRVGKECLPARSRSVDFEEEMDLMDFEEEKPARKLGLYQSCNSNSDCQSGRCAGRVGKECLPARSRSVDSEEEMLAPETETESFLARLTNLFSSGRSVDSEEKPARKLGLYQSCNSNSDCQ